MAKEDGTRASNTAKVSMALAVETHILLDIEQNLNLTKLSNLSLGFST